MPESDIPNTLIGLTNSDSVQADRPDAQPVTPADETADPGHPTIKDHARGPGAVAHALEQLVRVHFARSFVQGLQPAQWHALRYFAVMPQDQRSVTAFARHRGSTMGTASTTISTLVRKGYLGRRGSGARNSGLYVTDAGHQLLRDDPINGLVQAIHTLDDHERAALEQVLPKLVGLISSDDA